MNKNTIFKKGSTTYYYSSLFFPAEMRQDVFTLYAFVRTADDYVDAIPQQIKAFNNYKTDTYKSMKGTRINNPIISEFTELATKAGITSEMINAFFDSMEADTKKNNYSTYFELQRYIYGSASVIGLMMAKIMKLPAKAYDTAKKQGEAMQLINFIRDIREDIDLGRTYIPSADLKKFKVSTLSPTTDKEIESFSKLVRYEIDRYFTIQEEASKGYSYIPYRYRIPIMTAASIYNWTARVIYKNPMIVFSQKVKPKPIQVIFAVFKNYFTI